jgi:hypothetical protein
MHENDKIIAAEQIKILKAQYCRGVDTRDLVLLRSIMAPDVVLDVRGATTDPVTGINAAPHVSQVALVGIENALAAIAGRPLGVSTVHQSLMPEIEIIDEQQAKAIWAMSDRIRFSSGPVEEMSGYGYYHETYEQLGTAWKLKTLKLERLRLDIKMRD